MTKDEQIENLRETIEHMGRRLKAKDEEIDRLRAALKDIANHTDVNADECAGIAERALNRQQTAGKQ